MDIAIVFLFGAIIGSFLNVCTYRIPKGESIVTGSSHCTSCGHKLSPKNLIPIFSFIFQRGRCSYCKKEISSRYLIIELINATLFTAIYIRYGFSPEFFGMIFLTSILVSITFIDIELRIIPNKLVIAAIVGGIIFYITSFFLPVTIYGDSNWWNPIIGAFSGSVLFLLIGLLGSAIYKTDAIGGGDIKILFPIGLFLGWKLMITAIFISVVSAALICIVLMIFKIINKKDAVPFGPFIAVGTIVTILFGWELLVWYF